MAALLAVASITAPRPAAAAQQAGIVEGSVVAAESGVPIEGVRVFVAGTETGALTDASGRYRLTGVRAGSVVIVTEILGRRAERRTVSVGTAAAASVDFRLEVEAVAGGELIVSASREAQRKSETPATIGVITGEEIRSAHPSHPSEIMNRIPGVYINVTGGEGHMAAIRQPKTTNPVYLYLEDGIPTRSTGFFNHNALYEVNVPQAERIEVVKGPSTALYGSDAIGGMVNVVTRSPYDDPGVSGSLEGGAYGFARLLAQGSAVRGSDGVLGELNLTRTDGWRSGTAYDRESGTLRWDRKLAGGSSLRTIATLSRIDQSTAGTSAISQDDYLNDPTINYTPISYRKIRAFRMSAAYEKLAGSSLISITPFARWNDMDILPNWSLTYDPGIWDTGHASAGALLKYRRDFAPLRGRIIAGADIDYSPGWHREWSIQATRDGKIFDEYTKGEAIYDYDVTFFGMSPYLQAEASPVDALRITAGLRYDHLGYDYENALGELATGSHRRPGSTSVSYDHLSPKLGATFEVSPALNFFAAYGHGFRAPSEGQLFRQGQAVNTVGLSPVKVDNVEGGFRGVLGRRVSVEASVYHMTKSDDILTLTNPDGSTETANAGKTLHRGVEVGVGAPIAAGVRLDVSYSYAKHSYEEWQPRANLDYSGNEMEDAAREIGNVQLGWKPAFVRGADVSLEWQRIGKYWMDADNTHRYPGHDLFNLRASAPLTRGISVFGRLANLTDERYAESAAYNAFRGEEFAPGLPRTVYLGLQYR